MQIAIIGAGISGLTCARQLQAQGHGVTVYEKSDQLGGRCATRDTELGGFDHGAQYFTANSEGFQTQVNAWRKTGLVAIWDGKLVKLDHGVSKAAGRSAPRYVAMPGMNALGKHLAQGLDVRTEQMVGRIDAFGSQWRLVLQSDGVPVDASAGPFDAVIVATTVNQAAVLLEPAAQLAKQAAKIRSAACWSLMLGFQEPLQLGYDGAWVGNSRLAWIARDGSKPGRRPGEHWVGHASAEWSAEHLEDDAERARDKLLKAFHEATGSQVQPVHAVAHRWRYAQVPKPLAKDCLWDPTLRIGACGDWFAAGLEGSGRLENAYLSGLMLAELIA
jgi:renalase